MLAHRTSQILRDLLIRQRNHHPNPQQWEALDWIAQHLTGMADGTGPQKFFLSSLDPGCGKTSCLVAFIRALLESPEHRKVGVVIFSNRLDDIYYLPDPGGQDDAMAAAGLVHDCFGHDIPGAKRRAEFAVLTSDESRNSLGYHDPNQARVLFTTQEHLQKRLKSLGSFHEVDSLYFQGKPRQVKAWDETILPGFPITIDRMEAYGLLAPLRKRMGTSEGLVNQLKADLDALGDWPADTLYTVRDYEAQFGVDREDLVGCVHWKHALRGIAMSLAMLQGKTGVVRADPRDNSNSLLTYSQDLPDDLAPMMITDASGRVRQTYLEWKLSKRPIMLDICPAAPKSYRNLKIHHWDRGGGKGSWRADNPTRDELIEGIEQIINLKPVEDYLIVHHRPLTGRAGGRKGIPSLSKVLRSRDRLVGDFKRLKFLTWGNHTATNQFRDIKNVILAGILYLPEPVYEATTRAAIGVTPEMNKDRPEQTQAVTDGEHRHNVLQALLRCHARTSPPEAQGACGEAEAWVIGSHNHGITDDMLRAICPGAIVDRWSPNGEDRRKPMWEKAAEYIIGWCQEHPMGTLRVIDLAQAMATRPQHIREKCQLRPSFQVRLEFAGIEDRRGFRLKPAA